VPIQMPTDEAREWERKLQGIYQKYQEGPDKQLCLKYMRSEQEASAAGMLEVVTDPKAIEYFQTRAYDLVQVRPHFTALQQVFPELMGLYDDWNEYFLACIEKTLAESRGERMMVIVGGYHKYWLWDRLAGREDVELHDLSSYRALQGKR